MADVAAGRMTVAEFLTWDDGTDRRYELIDGRPVATSAAAASHSVIIANLAHELRSWPPSPWYGGLRAGVEDPARDDRFYLADVVISRTPVESAMAAIPDPVVVVEVFSLSSIDHDCGRKASDYRRIESVQEIVLVSSEERHVVVWRRRGTKWEVEDLIGDAALEVETVGVTVPFAAIYADSGVGAAP
jgi:Uma2 family endonuclease